MSLTVPPPASTYHAALRKEAAKQYNVPEGEIVLGEVNVGYYSELNGTIRGWKANAPVGRTKKRGGSASALSAAGTSTCGFPRYLDHQQAGQAGMVLDEGRGAEKPDCRDRGRSASWTVSLANGHPACRHTGIRSSMGRTAGRAAITYVDQLRWMTEKLSNAGWYWWE